MTRKPILLTILTTCLVAIAMLAAPSATASSDGYHDCTQRSHNIRKARFISAAHMQVFSYYDSYVTGLIDDAIEDLAANAGGDPGTLHTIASYAEQHLGWEAKTAKRYLKHIERRKIKRNLRKCPALFGRSLAENTGMKRSVALRQVELRDQLNAALADALIGGE